MAVYHLIIINTIDSSLYNCAFSTTSVGSPFLFFPAPDKCEDYQWTMRMTIQNVTSNKIATLDLESCVYRPYGAPTGGNCSVVSSTTKQEICDLSIPVTIQCSGWVDQCDPNDPSEYTYSVRLVSDLGPFEIAYSLQPEMDIYVSSNTTVEVYICNSHGACGVSNQVNVTVCNPNETEAGVAINYWLDRAWDCLGYFDPDCAVRAEIVSGVLVPACVNGSNSGDLALLFNQTLEIFEYYLKGAGDQASYLPDLTTLLQLWVVASGKSCDPLSELLYTLGLICESKEYSRVVASAALDRIAAKTFDPANAGEFFEILDSTLEVNNCYQDGTPIHTCGVKTSLLYQGEIMSYLQEVVTLDQLRQGFQITFYNATFKFPPNFDLQIIDAYLSDTNHAVTDIYCVVFHMTSSVAVDPPKDVTNATLRTPVSGITVRFLALGSDGYPINAEITLRNLVDVFIVFSVNCPSRKTLRYVFRPPAINNMSTPAYYIGNGSFATDGISFVNISEDGCLVTASVQHFSNFGLLFETRTQDYWDTYQIISLALFAATWFFLILFMVVVTFSVKVRRNFRFMTQMEETNDVLGD